jgi:hypothetical protein
MINNNKKIFKVKFKYFEFEFEHNFKKPCLAAEYGEFFFNWSLETTKQFSRHLLSMQPTKFYISSTSEIEAITTKIETFQKIMDMYNKLGNQKIDKFELISIIPFIVDNNFEDALSSSLSFFCLENENANLNQNEKIITRNEVGLFIDSFFRAVHNMVLLDDIDSIYEKTQKNILRLSNEEIEEMCSEIFDENVDEMILEETTK